MPTIHLYFTEQDVLAFKSGRKLVVYGRTEQFKKAEDTVHISVALDKVNGGSTLGEFSINRRTFY